MPNSFRAWRSRFEIFQCVFVIDVVAFQEAVDFVTGFEAEETPEVRLVDVTKPVFFSCPSFEDPTRKIASAHATGDVVRDLQHHIHAPTLPGFPHAWSIHISRPSRLAPEAFVDEHLE
jgi:hypothetical protein